MLVHSKNRHLFAGAAFGMESQYYAQRRQSSRGQQCFPDSDDDAAPVARPVVAAPRPKRPVASSIPLSTAKLQTNTALLRTLANQADDDDSPSSAVTRRTVAMPVINRGKQTGVMQLPVLDGYYYGGILDDIEDKAKAVGKAILTEVTGGGGDTTPAHTDTTPAGGGGNGQTPGPGPGPTPPSSGIPKYVLYGGAGLLGLGLAYYLSQS